MRFEIKEMQKRFGITVVYVTHDQTEAMAMSDRVIVFNKGEVQQIDSPMNIYRKPANEFVADFVGRINFISGTAYEDRIEFSEGQSMKYSGEKRGSVTVAVRPENITMSRDNGVLKGKMFQSYYLGDVNDCRIDTGHEILRVIAPGHTYGDIQTGSEVYLSFSEFIVF